MVNNVYTLICTTENNVFSIGLKVLVTIKCIKLFPYSFLKQDLLGGSTSQPLILKGFMVFCISVSSIISLKDLMEIIGRSFKYHTLLALSSSSVKVFYGIYGNIWQKCLVMENVCKLLETLEGHGKNVWSWK